jgi:capsular polysaccharide biosynthesis protein
MGKEERIGIVLLKLTIRNWLLIILTVLGAGAGAYIFTSSYFVTPKYKAEAALYPPSANTSTGLINSDMRFGADRDIDNAMQVLQSSLLRDSIIKKYNLVERYEIDTADVNKDYLIQEEYNENISIERTRYGSIAVKVYDKDPRMAASMANDIVAMGDVVKAEAIRKNLKNAFRSVEHELSQKTVQVMAMADSINYLRRKNSSDALNQLNQHFVAKKETVDQLRNSIDQVRNQEGIYDLNEQFDATYTAYLDANTEYVIDSGMVAVMSKYYGEKDTALVKRKAMMEGAKSLAQSLKTRLTSLNKKGALYNGLQDRYNFEKSVLSDVQGDYEISRSSFDKEYSNVALSTLKSRYEAELAILNSLKTKYELALSNLTDLIPSSYLVSPATPSTKKVYPQRLLITLLACISAYLITIILLFAARNKEAILSALKD